MDMERVRSKTMPEHTHIWRCLSTGDLPEIKLLFPHPFFLLRQMTIIQSEVASGMSINARLVVLLSIRKSVTRSFILRI